jgi:hypothetical protein
MAVELGAAGATVYVTGRSTRGAPATGYAGFLERSGLPAMPSPRHRAGLYGKGACSNSTSFTQSEPLSP